jgi:mono/diheme cytochrome c family protein
MSYSLDTGLVYIPATETYGVFAQDPNYVKNPGGFNLGVSFGGAGQAPVNANDDERGTIGRLIAWDPVNAREVWRSDPFPTQGGGIQMTGGIVSTAGNIVVQGNVGNHEVAAYRATDGEKLWSFDAKTGVMASPITYEIGGEQYFAIAVGGPAQGGYYAPNGARLLVFKLGGTATIPDLPEYEQPPYVDVPQVASAEVVTHGEELFRNNCSLCHGQGAAARATFPDLRRSAAVTDQSLFDTIVLEGVLGANGMASFDDRLDPPDTEAIRAYLIAQAEAARNAPAFGFGGPPPAGEPEEEEAEIHEDPNAEN